MTSNEFSHIFDDIIENLETMSNNIGEISLASKEQDEGIIQINEALNQVTEVGQVIKNLFKQRNFKTLLNDFLS